MWILKFDNLYLQLNSINQLIRLNFKIVIKYLKAKLISQIQSPNDRLYLAIN